MKNAVFYHDGCEICSEVGKELVGLVGLSKLDIIHVGLNPAFLEKAEKAGVKAYPALITANGNVLHFNTEQHEGNIACLF
jgi:glutaredoxin 3